MSNADIFLDKYKQLEVYAVREYKLPQDGSAVAKLEKRKEFKCISYELNYCREVRNLLQHNQKVDEEFAVIPSDKMIQMLEDVIDKVKNPVKCIDVAIPFTNLVWRSPFDYVMPAIKIMNDRNISHVPILRDKRVIGDFSDNCVFPYLLGDKDCQIDDKTKFEDLGKYIGLDAHPSESFKFISAWAKLSEAEKMYEDAYKRHERIGMIFLTENGQPSERLIGVLNSWVIMGNVRN